jgi:uncharacterized protein YndB with AHSA1/START domain
VTQQTTSDFDPNAVRKSMSVQAPPAIAWRVFTEKMSSWWPLGHYKIGTAKAVEAIIEPHVGGRWYERGEDGSTCDWGRVLVWEPDSRLVLTWDINADWQYDPKLNTEIEIRSRACAGSRRPSRPAGERPSCPPTGAGHGRPSGSTGPRT